MNDTNFNWSGDIRYVSTNFDTIPEAGGIYKVLKNDGKVGELTRVYVGKAVNLRSQYNFHLSNNEDNECLKSNLRNNECYFRYALLSGEENRRNAESPSLETGNYECNIQGQ